MHIIIIIITFSGEITYLETSKASFLHFLMQFFLVIKNL